MKTPAPRWVCLQLLQACNLRCTLCYEWGETGAYLGPGKSPVLGLDVIERLVEELAPFKPHYDLFGGEPLLHPRIDRIVEAIKGAGSTVYVVTNGTTLEEHAELLRSVDLVWVSVDGPEAINDRQRGAGTFARITRGVEALHAARRRPGIGASMAVTPLNHPFIEETFLRALDRRLFDHASIELQSFITPGQLQEYGAILSDRFGRHGTKHAAAFVRDPADFASIDAGSIQRQVEAVRATWTSEGKRVLTKPLTTTAASTRAYFDAHIEGLADYHSRCVYPWLYAEVSATGDVTPCHAFYDLTFGNVNERAMLDIWRSDAFDHARAFFQERLMPVCAACCLYHTRP